MFKGRLASSAIFGANRVLRTALLTKGNDPLSRPLHRVQIAHSTSASATPPATPSFSGIPGVSSIISGFGMPGVTFPGAPTAEHAGIIFFSNVFPAKIHRIDIRYKFSRFNAEHMLQRLNSKVFVDKVDVCEKEGGILVHFNAVDADTESILTMLLESLAKYKARGLFTKGIEAHLVRGKPFVDDLLTVYPSLRLAVNYRAKEGLTEEILFKEFRKYGEIYNINCDVKVQDGVRTSVILFKNLSSAVAAKNCMHGAKIGPEKSALSCKYEAILESSRVTAWVNNHSKIMFPIILGLVALLTYLVIDPLRVFFITNHITHRFSFHLKDRVMSGIQFLQRADIDQDNNHQHRHESKGLPHNTPDLDELKMHLRADPGSIIFLTGATGSGKSELVKKAVESYKNVLVINMRKLDPISDEADFISAFTRQIGCIPGFTFSTIIGHISDLAGMSPKGLASSMTLDGKVNQVLQCLGYALQVIYKKQGHKSGDPFDIPVVIFRGLEIEHINKHENFYSLILTWAGLFSSQRCAHIVFTSDPQVHDEVHQRKLIELDKKVQNVLLADTDPEDAIDFVRSALGKDLKEEEVQRAVRLIGGRMTDLQTLIRKVQYGMNLKDASHDMIERAASSLRKKGLGERPKSADGASDLPWMKSHFWLVLQLLAKHDEVPYDDIVFHPLFAGDSSKLHAMVRADLVRVVDEVGKPKIVKPSRPLFRAAFNYLLHSPALSENMEIIKNKDLIAIEQAKIDKIVDELEKLENVHGTPDWTTTILTLGLIKLMKPQAVASRQRFLIERLQASSQTISLLTAENSKRTALLKNAK